MPTAWPEFAKASATRPFAWGDDCLIDTADWVLAATGIDVAAPFRGRYSDAETCRALFRGRGGLTKALRSHMARLGFAETEAPQPGDPGLVKAFGVVLHERRAARFAMGAVRLPSGRWRLKSMDGHISHDFPLIVAWSLASCRR